MTLRQFPVIDEPGYTHDWLASSPDREFGTVEGTVKGGSGDLASGTVLGIETATGKYVPYSPDATDGSEVPAGINYYPARAATQDVKCAIFTHEFLVIASGLKWHASVDTPAKKAAALKRLADERRILTRHLI